MPSFPTAVDTNTPAVEVQPTAATNPKKKAAIIDDAFDDVEATEVTHAQYFEFFQLASQDVAFSQLLSELNLTMPEVDEDAEIPLEFLQTLWRLREEYPVLKAMVDAHLLVDKAAKLTALEVICQNLESQGLEVERINSKVENPSIFESGEFYFIFIDYNLGVTPGEAAITNAKIKARQIYNACPLEKKPVTILMSSMANVLEEKDRFQAESGMVEGVFRFSPKQALENINQVKLLVRAYKEEFTSNHALQLYINALTNAANEALKEFQKEVRMMRIDDYVFIQNSALLEQAQPLGDYLAWLYGSHWANLLLRNKELKTQQERIDTVLSRSPPLHHEIPSPKVTDIYMSALFEDELSPVAYHPLEPQGPLTDKPASQLAKLPYLHLGDLFTKKEEDTVWMVLNAQCDLERANEANKKRSIFLVPGTLHPLNKTPLDAQFKTEFFKFNDKQYRISWEVKNVTATPHDEFEAWQKSGNYERHHRLRLPFALEIQQAFSASVTRIGLPVSPPFTQDIMLEVLYKSADGSANTLLPPSSNYAFQPVTRKEDKVVRLTLTFASDFKNALEDKKNELMNRLREITDAPGQNAAAPLAYISEAITSIEKIMDKFEDLFFDKKGFIFPETNKPAEAFKGQISVTLDTSKSTFLKVSKSFVLFNIVTPPVPAAAPELENKPVANEPEA